jgi:arylsulfatase A-like enzyme
MLYRFIPHRLVTLLLCSAGLSCTPGCGRGDAATNAVPQPQIQKEPPPQPRLPGDRLAYRFVDHAGEARLEVGPPGLQASWTNFRYPYKLPSPYSGLRGETALRAIEVALADADVAGYGGASAPAKAAAPVRVPRFDPVWNRARAVYQSRSSLLSPAPSRYTFRVRLPKQGLMTLSLAAIPATQGAPGQAPIEFSVEIDGKQAFRKVIGPGPGAADGGAGRWHEAELPVSGDGLSDVSFVTRPLSPGTPVGMAVWGNPLLWAREEGTPGPNFLFVVIDTLRADALQAMPNLTAYAKKGARFNQAITAATWTRPSILSMLGGDLPTAIGQSAEAIIPPDAERRRFYALGPTLLPRVLRARGWRTTAIGNNFFLLGYPQIGLDLGFEEVADVRHPVLDTPAITRAAVDFIQKNKSRPFFLHLHYDAPHWPYTPPPPYLGKIPETLQQKLLAPENGQRLVDPQAKAYLAEAAYADAELKTVLDEVERQGLAERTLVVVVGDHGEIFDPRHSHFVVSLGLPTLYHHGWTAYDELLKVPLLLALPGRLPSGREVPAQVRLTDIAPTVLDILGLPREVLPGGPRGRGRSLLSLINGEKEETERIAFVEGQNVKAVRAEGWAYIRRTDGRLQRAIGNGGAGPVVDVTEELYDLTRDPVQHSNLATSTDPAVLTRLLRMRAIFEQEMPRPPDRQLPVLHIRVAPHGKQVHRVTGTVTTAGTNLAVRSLVSGEMRPDAPNRLLLSLESGGGVDLLVDPEARLELQLAVDGAPLQPGRILLGPYGLPLLAERKTEKGEGGALPGAVPVAVIDGPLLSRLDAPHPPVLGDRGEVLVWRDQGAATPLAATSSEAAGGPDESEIAGMMRNWGYAQAEHGKEGQKEGQKDAPQKDAPQKK